MEILPVRGSAAETGGSRRTKSLMSMWKRAGIAAVVAAATIGIAGPAASAASAPWETSRVHHPTPAQGTAVPAADETGTVSIRCGPPCYQ